MLQRDELGEYFVLPESARPTTLGLRLNAMGMNDGHMAKNTFVGYASPAR